MGARALVVIGLRRRELESTPAAASELASLGGATA
jgi:hypothetical protein